MGRSLGNELVGSAASLAAGGAVLLSGYLLLARVLHVRELDTLLAAVRSRVGR